MKITIRKMINLLTKYLDIINYKTENIDNYCYVYINVNKLINVGNMILSDMLIKTFLGEHDIKVITTYITPKKNKLTINILIKKEIENESNQKNPIK